jgi:hypothetical protein
LALEWGLSRLALDGGIIDHDDVSPTRDDRNGLSIGMRWAETDAASQALKPILHALLISGTLPHLSIAGNRKIKAPGWRMVAAYVRKVRVVMALPTSSKLMHLSYP